MIDAEARAREGVHPVIQQQRADDEAHEEVHKIAGTDGFVMQPEGHGARVPVHHHADQNEQRDAAQLDKPELREGATILGGQIGEVVRELIQPIDPRAGAGKCLR